MRAPLRTLLASIGLLWLQTAHPLPVRAQITPPPGPAGALVETYQAGMRAFNAGDYKQAVESLREVVAKAADDPQLEGVYYTLGAALYNQPDYPAAIRALETYRTKFPRGARLTDATFALAQAQLASKNFPEAAKLLAGLENVPAWRERVLLIQAGAFREQKKTDEAIATLKRLVGTEPRTPLSVQGALLLVTLLGEKGDPTAAAALLAQLSSRPALVNNALDLNAIALDLGDQLLKDNKFQPALACYRLARPRERVIENQKRRVAAAARAVQMNLENTRASAANPARASELAGQAAELRADLAAAQGQQAEAEKLPARYDAALLLRMSRCFMELDRKWESVVILRDLLDRTPADAPEREPAFYGLVVSLAEVAPADEIRQTCADYLREFPQGANAPAVGYLAGASALQTQDLDAAVLAFGRMLEDKNQQNSPFREQMLYGLANARFLLGKYDEALGTYQRYQQAYPKGTFAEEVLYRVALSNLLTNKPDEARGRFNDYATRFPQGVYLPDVRYRLGMIRFANEQYAEVLSDCGAWEKQYGNDPQLGEMLSLKGDTLAALDRTDEAATAYERAARVASTDEVANYTLSAAAKLLQKAGRWDRIADLCQGFVRDKPDSPVALTALAWIAKAKSREGKVDEARQFLAETIKKHIADPKREAVELMVTQLATLCMKRPPAPATAESAAAATPTPAPAYDPQKTLDVLLPPETAGDPPTAQARVLYAQAELARLRKKPAEQEAAFQRIADRVKPEALSQPLLAQVGDFLLSRGQNDRAAALFGQLLEGFPKGDWLDFAYHGFGEIAFQKKDYPTALRWFTDGTEKIAAAQKLKDVTVGRAKTLLALDRLEEARKTFMQIASVREWRGEATAFSTFSLGEVEKRQGRWAEAHAHYQRVYVVYGRYLPWVAKAYLEAADCLEKLGKNPEAVATLREMLRNAKLADFAETREAQNRLQKLGAGAS